MTRPLRQRRDPGTDAEVVRRDRQAARLLSAAPVRLVTLSAVALTAGVLWARTGWATGFGLATAAIVGTAVWVTLFRAARPAASRAPHAAASGDFVDARAHATGIVVAAVGMPLLLWWAGDVDVRVFSPLFVLVVVGILFAGPCRWRVPLAGLVIGSLLVTLWVAGERVPAELLVQVGGAVLALAAVLRISDTLSNAVVAAEQTRDAADLRDGLLSSLLATTSLEPAEVLRATVDGLLEVGFTAASIRHLDHQARVAELIEGVARDDVVVPRELPFDGSMIPDVLRERRALVVQDADRDPRTARAENPVAAAVFLPLYDDDEVVAIVAAVRTSGRIGEEQLAAAELLAAQADGALRRARAYGLQQRTLADLRSVDRRIQDFVSTLSHELRTPLTVIHGLGRTLTERWQELDAPVRRDLLRRIDGNADRLATMLTSLLDTSAWEAGELRLTPRPVPLRSLIDEVVHRAAGLTSRHPVRIDVPRELVVVADAALLTHVIENLFANVEKHTTDGTRVEVRAVADGDRVRMEIEDDGPGIAPEDLPHVLERFYRGGRADTRGTSGLGLGLALAQDIVQAHGGTLQVASMPTGGTTFAFSLARGSAPPDR